MIGRISCGLAGLAVLSLALMSGNGHAEVFGGVEFPGGAESFADKVVSYNPVIDEWDSPKAPFRVPGNALGPPDFPGGYVYEPAKFVSLGNGGSITLMFTDNSLTGSGNDSFDLWIFEAGGDVEATFVKISKDGAKWFDVGKIAGSTRGIDIDRYGYGPNDFFLYVRLTDDPDQGTPSSKDLPTPGADIDAVGAISSAPPVEQPRLSASPEVVKVGESIAVIFSDVPKDLPDAVIIVMDANYPDIYSPFDAFHLNGQTNGATAFTMEVPGEYNARLLEEAFVGPWGSSILGERLAVSNTVRVVLGEKKRLTISEVTGSPGQTVSVPVNINDAEGLAGLDITIAYDSSALTFNEVKASSFGGLAPVVNSGVAGKIILRIVGYDIPDGGSPFLNMSFTVNPNAVANTEASITVESIEAFNEDGGDISITAQGGKVKLESPYMKGDLDGDGKIRSNDAIILLRISAGLVNPTPQQLLAADFNNDGEIKSNDAILILRQAANSSSAPDRSKAY